MQGSSIPETVLVTGGAGFIGSRLVSELMGAGRRVVVVDDYSSGRRDRLQSAAPMLAVADIGAPGVLAGLLADERPGCIVHLAARVGVRRVLADPEGCRDENLRGVGRLVRALAEMPAGYRPRLLAASTSEVYREKRAPLDEGDPLRPLDGRGRWAYAASKRRAEQELDHARAWTSGSGPLHLRFFNVVGPGQDADQGMVLPTFVEQALAGEPVTVHGDGDQVRTFAHVDDVARDLASLVVRETMPGGALNLGGTAVCTMEELARCVVRIAGSRSEIVRVDPRQAVSTRFEEVRHREPSLARARALDLARTPRSLEAIVSDTVARHAALQPPRESCASPAS
ncbi:MAG: NAD-dependent epimerase/dehydratase family protein [bacterium]|nr:NAD-dependent epimerase/dehydratase family protein [bacterium]